MRHRVRAVMEGRSRWQFISRMQVTTALVMLGATSSVIWLTRGARSSVLPVDPVSMVREQDLKTQQEFKEFLYASNFWMGRLAIIVLALMSANYGLFLTCITRSMNMLACGHGTIVLALTGVLRWSSNAVALKTVPFVILAAWTPWLLLSYYYMGAEFQDKVQENPGNRWQISECCTGFLCSWQATMAFFLPASQVDLGHRD